MLAHGLLEWRGRLDVVSRAANRPLLDEDAPRAAVNRGRGGAYGELRLAAPPRLGPPAHGAPGGIKNADHHATGWSVSSASVAAPAGWPVSANSFAIVRRAACGALVKTGVPLANEASPVEPEYGGAEHHECAGEQRRVPHRQPAAERQRHRSVPRN